VRATQRSPFHWHHPVRHVSSCSAPDFSRVARPGHAGRPPAMAAAKARPNQRSGIPAHDFSLRRSLLHAADTLRAGSLRHASTASLARRWPPKPARGHRKGRCAISGKSRSRWHPRRTRCPLRFPSTAHSGHGAPQRPPWVSQPAWPACAVARLRRTAREGAARPRKRRRASGSRATRTQRHVLTHVRDESEARQRTAFGGVAGRHQPPPPPLSRRQTER